MNLNILLAFLLAFGIGIITGPFIIKKLKEFSFGQIMREDGPQEHLNKKGTPIMGGVIFEIAAIISTLVFAKINVTSLLLIGGMLLFGLMGLLDDGLKVKKKQNEGLTVKQKLVMNLVFSVLFALTVWFENKGSYALSIPFTDKAIGFNLIFTVLFIILFFTAVTNSVNLADGIDGLCGSVSLVVSAFYMFLGIYRNNMTVTVFAAALCGGLIAYLFFNWHPARVFMGDTGSFALGGALGALAVMTGTEILFILIGLIYVIEAVSVILQVGYFKKTHKRLFKMAPIHHHFQKSGWAETKIVGIFTLITILSCLAAYFAAIAG